MVIMDDFAIETSTSWLSHFGIQLLDSDRLILQSCQLSDNHIDFAQEILKQQFPSILGLQSTLLVSAGCCSRVALKKKSLFIQIVYSKSRKHWITVTTRGQDSSIIVYDSVFSTIEDDTKRMCEKWFGSRMIETVPVLTIRLAIHTKKHCTTFSPTTCLSYPLPSSLLVSKLPLTPFHPSS